MVSEEPRLATRFGCYAAAAHLVLAGVTAVSVAGGGSSAGERWVYLGILDTPMNVLFAPLLQHLALGGWEQAFPYLYFLVLGTAFWYSVGWFFGHITHVVRHGSW